MTEQRARALADFTMTVAVFAYGGDPAVARLELLHVHLEADTGETWTAEAAARGYRYVGYFSVKDGEPKVHIEPGEAVVMGYAGYLFAGTLGEQLKQHQLRAQREKVGP